MFEIIDNKINPVFWIHSLISMTIGLKYTFVLKFQMHYRFIKKIYEIMAKFSKGGIF